MGYTKSSNDCSHCPIIFLILCARNYNRKRKTVKKKILVRIKTANFILYTEFAFEVYSWEIICLTAHLRNQINLLLFRTFLMFFNITYLYVINMLLLFAFCVIKALLTETHRTQSLIRDLNFEISSLKL